MRKILRLRNSKLASFASSLVDSTSSPMSVVERQRFAHRCKRNDIILPPIGLLLGSNLVNWFTFSDARRTRHASVLPRPVKRRMLDA
jgi:hypothetical protein